MLMSFREFITEGGGQAPGELEVGKTSLKQARAYAEAAFASKGMSLDEELPNFDRNFMVGKKWSTKGWTKRKDMPVINYDDVKLMQKRLKSGRIDINPPYADDSEPFPEGLSGQTAKSWLDKGLRDGESEDDIVSVNNFTEPAQKISPIQEQIYFDKSLDSIVEFGVDGTRKFIEKVSKSIVSGDLYLIDGHHRHLAAILVDPQMKISGVKIDLPIKKLLEMTLSYGDAIGNKRNL